MNSYLDPLDSAFILLETPGTAMNIGAVIELDFGDVLDPKQRYEMISTNIEARIHEIPILTKRIVRAPFDMTWPILVSDKNFDFAKHVLRVALPAPGNSEQFEQLISNFLSQPLAAKRPLWQLLVIEGLEDGRAALALKVHHALADGVSGAETFANLFDISPEVRVPAPHDDREQEDRPITSSLGIIRFALARVRERPMLMIDNLRSWSTRIFEISRSVLRVVLIRRRRISRPINRQSSKRKDVAQRHARYRKGVPPNARILGRCEATAKGQGASVTDFVWRRPPGRFGDCS